MFQFADSYDHYASALLTEKYTELSGTFGANHTIVAEGRNSTSCLKASNGSRYAGVGLTGAPTTIFLGVAYKADSLPTNTTVFQFVSPEANTHLSVYHGAGGALQINLGTSTLIATTDANTVLTGQWTYLEFKITINNLAGRIQVYSDGVLKLDAIGLDTYNGGTVGVGVVRLGGTNGNNVATTQRWDDLLIMDNVDVGDGFTDFKGDLQVRVHFPDGVGTHAEWTRAGADSGANWSQVDEAAANGDTDTVQATLTGKKDTYAFEALKTPGQTILGIQSVHEARKIDAGTATVGTIYRHAGVDYAPASGQSLNLTHRFARQFNATNPGTGAAWTEAAFNAIEAGPYKNT